MSTLMLLRTPSLKVCLLPSRRRAGNLPLGVAAAKRASASVSRFVQWHGRRIIVEVAAAIGDRPSSSGRRAVNVNPDGVSRPRLAKVLAACGVASRRACEVLIAEGRVRVNGRVVLEQGTTIVPLEDRVEVLQQAAKPDAGSTSTSSAAATAAGPGTKGKRQKPPRPQQRKGGEQAVPATAAVSAWKLVPVRFFQEAESLFYFAVNKPKGFICSSTDVNGRGKLAVELLAPWLGQWKRTNKDPKRLPPRLFTVGRLDVASSGLIFLTNDGEWANRVIHPSSGVTKEYVVAVAADASRPQLETLAAGTEVAGSFVSPLEVEVLGDPRRLRIVVEEGKKHEVRELVKAAGMELLSLRRVRIGGYRLPRDLGIGGYRALKPSDLRLVTDLKAQEVASASGETRQQQQLQAQQQRAAAAKAAVPRALRAMPEDVLDLLRRAQQD